MLNSLSYPGASRNLYSYQGTENTDSVYFCNQGGMVNTGLIKLPNSTFKAVEIP